MEYGNNINERMIAYCNAKGYETLEERWEKDGHSNHHYTSWLGKQRAFFFTEQTGDQPSSLRDPEWGNLKYKLWGYRHRNEFDLWLRTKYPHKIATKKRIHHGKERYCINRSGAEKFTDDK